MYFLTYYLIVAKVITKTTFGTNHTLFILAVTTETYTHWNTHIPTHLCNFLIGQLCSSSAVHKTMLIRASSFSYCSHQSSVWGKNCDLGDLDCGMIVGARQVGLSIFISANLLGFSHLTMSFSNSVNKKVTGKLIEMPNG